METTQTVKTRTQFLRFLQKKLTESGIEEAEEEALRTLEEVLGVTRTGLFIDPEKEVPQEAEERSLKILTGRGKRIPLAYLLGTADFWQETLFVSEDCLIPRPETEFLVERIIETFRDKGQNLSFLDIGTGSGAIAVALLRMFRNARGTLLDVSAKALGIARKNAEKYGLSGRATFLEGDLFAPFGPGEKWDLIVSNPPYLSEADLLAVEPELKAEPRIALDGGADGLEFYRRIVPAAKRHLNDGGLLALELGAGQVRTVSTWLREAGYANIQSFKDYLGIERVITAKN